MASPSSAGPMSIWPSGSARRGAPVPSCLDHDVDEPIAAVQQLPSPTDSWKQQTGRRHRRPRHTHGRPRSTNDAMRVPQLLAAPRRFLLVDRRVVAGAPATRAAVRAPPRSPSSSASSPIQPRSPGLRALASAAEGRRSQAAISAMQRARRGRAIPLVEMLDRLDEASIATWRRRPRARRNAQRLSPRRAQRSATTIRRSRRRRPAPPTPAWISPRRARCSTRSPACSRSRERRRRRAQRRCRPRGTPRRRRGNFVPEKVGMLWKNRRRLAPRARTVIP